MSFFAEIKIKDASGNLVNATYPLSVILEKLNSNVSANTGTQLKTTQYRASGTEGTLLQALAAGISSNTGAQLNVSIFDPSGNDVSTADGYLSVYDRTNGLSIAKGDVTGTSFIHKFGQAPDFDQADGNVTVWDGANDGLFGGSPPMVYTYSATADITLISSSNNGDTQDIEIQGLDTNWAAVTQTVTLTGQTDATLSTALIRVSRMKNMGTTDFAGVVYLRTTGSAQTAGVPDTANTVRAIVNDGNNQTLMAVYSIPAGYTGYMRDWYVATAGASKSSQYKVKLRARPFGGVFQLKHMSSISDVATSYLKHEYSEPELFAAKTDIQMTIEALASGATAAEIAAGFDIVLVAN